MAHVFPLFNRDPLRIPIEYPGHLVTKKSRVVLSRSPTKAITQLESDIGERVWSYSSPGFHLAIRTPVALKWVVWSDDDELFQRVVELWGFFWDQALPYAGAVRVN